MKKIALILCCVGAWACSNGSSSDAASSEPKAWQTSDDGLFKYYVYSVSPDGKRAEEGNSVVFHCDLYNEDELLFTTGAEPLNYTARADGKLLHRVLLLAAAQDSLIVRALYSDFAREFGKYEYQFDEEDSLTLRIRIQSIAATE